MTDDDYDEALDAVLDPGADQNVPNHLRRAAERDLETIQRGLALLAEHAYRPSQEPAPGVPAPARTQDSPLPAPRTIRPLPHPRRPLRPLLAASVAIAAAIGVTVLLRPWQGHPSDVAAGTPRTTQGQGPIAPPQPPAGIPSQPSAATPESLSSRVRHSQRIVVGTVTSLEPGTAPDATAYLLVTIRISEAIKGPAGRVFVLDRSDGGPTNWKINDRVLVFLTPDDAPATIPEPHLTVEGHGAGRYRITNGRLVDADFTLDDVRRAANN